MITTELDTSKRIICHTATATVVPEELVQAVEATAGAYEGVLWDFRSAQFAVSLHVINSPTYPPVRERANTDWQSKRVAFVVASQLHKLMIQTFAEEGGFTFVWQIFFDRDAAERWLQGDLGQDPDTEAPG